MLRSKIILFFTAVSFLLIGLVPLVSTAATININSPEWLGHLKLNKKQLMHIKKAVTKALHSPIDNEIECGEIRMDCVVRTAREWAYQGNRYREIVVNLHTIGHASRTVGQTSGRWPTIITGFEQPRKHVNRNRKKQKKKGK